MKMQHKRRKRLDECQPTVSARPAHSSASASSPLTLFFPLTDLYLSLPSDHRIRKERESGNIEECLKFAYYQSYYGRWMNFCLVIEFSRVCKHKHNRSAFSKEKKA